MRQDAAGAGHRDRRGRTPVRTPGLDARRCDSRLRLAAAGRALRYDGVLPQPRRLGTMSNLATFLLVLLVAACASPHPRTARHNVPDTLSPRAHASLAMIFPAHGLKA